jgi:hypothetical protein
VKIMLCFISRSKDSNMRKVYLSIRKRDFERAHRLLKERGFSDGEHFKCLAKIEVLQENFNEAIELYEKVD